MVPWRRTHSDSGSRRPSSNGALLQDSLLGKTSINGRYQDPVKGPAVVVHNARGAKRILEVAKTPKDAQVRADAIEQEFKTLDTAQWCERYDVPLSFVSG
jgi:hypothetical protein